MNTTPDEAFSDCRAVVEHSTDYLKFVSSDPAAVGSGIKKFLLCDDKMKE
jgi:hypothetical protein